MPTESTAAASDVTLTGDVPMAITDATASDLLPPEQPVLGGTDDVDHAPEAGGVGDIYFAPDVAENLLHCFVRQRISFSAASRT